MSVRVEIRTPADAADERRYLLVLGVVVALAALLRFVGLGRQPLWVDEHLTWVASHPGPGHGLWEQFRDNIQGPLYILLSWGRGAVHGFVDEASFRLPSAIAGVLAVPVVFKAGEVWCDRRTGAWAALLLALNPFHVWYSQEARGYALMLLFAAAATWQFLRMRRDGATPAGGLLYGLLATAVASRP